MKQLFVETQYLYGNFTEREGSDAKLEASHFVWRYDRGKGSKPVLSAICLQAKV